MGIPELEACFLPRETGSDEISALLRRSAKYGGSKPHFSSASERHHRAKMDHSDSGAFSVRNQGAPGDHAHQATEGSRGVCAALFRHHRTACPFRKTWPSAIPIAAKHESRPQAAGRISGNTSPSGTNCV